MYYIIYDEFDNYICTSYCYLMLLYVSKIVLGVSILGSKIGTNVAFMYVFWTVKNQTKILISNFKS